MLNDAAYELERCGSLLIDLTRGEAGRGDAELVPLPRHDVRTHLARPNPALAGARALVPFNVCQYVRFWHFWDLARCPT
jgi:hypothetical protein